MVEKKEANGLSKVIAGENELVATRIFDAPRELVFKAWTTKEHIAEWWGPKGFTNTFRVFDMRPGGTWEFTMHGPDGVNYENQINVIELTPPERIVLRHGSGHVFTITAIFEDLNGKTRLIFRQQFETISDFNFAKPFAEPANEQNLDRLGSVLANMSI